MKTALIWLALITAGTAEARHYGFDTSDFRINSPACLEDFRPHGADSQWACTNGILQGISVDAGMKRTAPVGDVYMTFEIVRRLPRNPGGRGETVIWLRNALDGGVMRRARIVLEERANGATAVRLEETDPQGGYRRLAVGLVPSYTGVYEVEFVDGWLSVYSQGQYVSAESSVLLPGGIYLFNSGNEGGATGYDNLDLDIPTVR